MPVDGLKSGHVHTSTLKQVDKGKPHPGEKKSETPDNFGVRTEREPIFGTVRNDSPANALIEGGVSATNVPRVLEHKHGNKISEALKHGAVVVAKEPVTTKKSISREALAEASLENNEELNHLQKEIAERRSKQAIEDIEFNLISTLISASSPIGAISLLATLKNTLGSLKSPSAIAFASACIGPIASMAKDMALIQAKKGSTDMARHLAEALGGSGGPIDRACQCESVSCSDEHIEHLESIIAETETTTTVQEFSLINPETGEVITDEDGCELTFEQCTCDELDECEEYTTSVQIAETEISDHHAETQVTFEDARKLAGRHENETEKETNSKAKLAEIKRGEKNTTSRNQFAKLQDEKAHLKSIIQA